MSDDRFPIDSGDVVVHRPTGENWVIGASTGKYVYPQGWPPTRANAADCDLVERASIAWFRETIFEWSEKKSSDERCEINQRRIQLLDKVFVGEGI